jgi:DNA-binding XRE family transcriptional regulator
VAELRACNSVAAFFPFMFDTTRHPAIKPSISITLVQSSTKTSRRATFTNPRAIKTFAKVVAPTQLRSLADLKAEMRSTPDGDAAWSRALKRREDGQRQAVAQNLLSKIRFYRLRAGLTQSELAEAMHTKQSNISRYERPSYKASRTTLEKLAAVLRVNLADLI